METKKSYIQLPSSLKDLPKDYSGYVVISDIDKTYLATQIDSIGGLLKTAFETAEAKDNIPGFSIALRALRRGGSADPQANPIYFVSASPPQMQATLMAKMELDGIEHDGIVFKDQLQHVRSRDFKKLKEQIGYKLEALLLLWLELPHTCKLILFGDDSESDPAIYSLFCDILGGVVRGSTLRTLLASLGVFSEENDKILSLANRVTDVSFPVELVFINLVTGSQAAYYSRFGPHFYATENTLQVALTLFEKNLIRERAVRSVGRDLALYYDFSPQRLLEALKQGAQRGLYGQETLRKLWPMLYLARVLPEAPSSDLEDHEVGELTRLSRQRWVDEAGRGDLKNLKLRYSDEGRY